MCPESRLSPCSTTSKADTDMEPLRVLVLNTVDVDDTRRSHVVVVVRLDCVIEEGPVVWGVAEELDVLLDDPINNSRSQRRPAARRFKPANEK